MLGPLLNIRFTSLPKACYRYKSGETVDQFRRTLLNVAVKPTQTGLDNKADMSVM